MVMNADQVIARCRSGCFPGKPANYTPAFSGGATAEEVSSGPRTGLIDFTLYPPATPFL